MQQQAILNKNEKKITNKKGQGEIIMSGILKIEDIKNSALKAIAKQADDENVDIDDGAQNGNYDSVWEKSRVKELCEEKLNGTNPGFTAREANRIFGLELSEPTKATEEEGKNDPDYTPRPEGKDAYTAGNNVFKSINWTWTKWSTKDYEYTAVNEAIDKDHLDKDNIVNFLSGFYAGGSHEGIIEYLDDEIDGGAISMTNKKNIIQSLIDCAEENGLKGDAEVRTLKMILKAYTTGQFKDETKYTTFNQSSGYEIPTMTTAGGAAVGAGIGAAVTSWSGGWGAVIGGAIGLVYGLFDNVTDNEQIDDLMRSIHKKLVDKGVQKY